MFVKLYLYVIVSVYEGKKKVCMDCMCVQLHLYVVLNCVI